MTLMNRSPYVSLLSKALAFVPCCRPADAALFLATHSYSAASGAPQSSLMAEYLVSSCGFDPDQAAKASKLLGHVESRHQPDSVLGLFKSYGFDNTQVKRSYLQTPVASPRRGRPWPQSSELCRIWASPAPTSPTSSDRITTSSATNPRPSCPRSNYGNASSGPTTY
ncbi:unnamed protein product [Musa acuminata subsp. burmannicoides]